MSRHTIIEQQLVDMAIKEHSAAKDNKIIFEDVSEKMLILKVSIDDEGNKICVSDDGVWRLTSDNPELTSWTITAEYEGVQAINKPRIELSVAFQLIRDTTGRVNVGAAIADELVN